MVMDVEEGSGTEVGLDASDSNADVGFAVCACFLDGPEVLVDCMALEDFAGLEACPALVALALLDFGAGVDVVGCVAFFAVIFLSAEMSFFFLPSFLPLLLMLVVTPVAAT